MAFQADAFQHDAFQILEEGYRLLQDMTPAASQHLADVVLRHQGEADDDEVINAIPDRAKVYVRSHLRKPGVKPVILTIALFVAGQGIDYIQQQQIMHGQQEIVHGQQDLKHELQHDELLQEQVRALLDELRLKHPRPPHP